MTYEFLEQLRLVINPNNKSGLYESLSEAENFFRVRTRLYDKDSQRLEDNYREIKYDIIGDIWLGTIPCILWTLYVTHTVDLGLDEAFKVSKRVTKRRFETVKSFTTNEFACPYGSGLHGWSVEGCTTVIASYTKANKKNILIIDLCKEKGNSTAADSKATPTTSIFIP